MAALHHNSPNSHDFEQKSEDHIDLSHVEKTAHVEAQFEIDPVIDKRVTRKFDAHILPWLFAIWSVQGIAAVEKRRRIDFLSRLFAFIDRSNIGNARIDGLTTDLHLDGNKFNGCAPTARFSAIKPATNQAPSCIGRFLCAVHTRGCAVKLDNQEISRWLLSPIIDHLLGSCQHFSWVHQIVRRPHRCTMPFRSVRGWSFRRNGCISCHVL